MEQKLKNQRKYERNQHEEKRPDQRHRRHQYPPEVFPEHRFTGFESFGNFLNDFFHRDTPPPIPRGLRPTCAFTKRFLQKGAYFRAPLSGGAKAFFSAGDFLFGKADPRLSFSAKSLFRRAALSVRKTLCAPPLFSFLYGSEQRGGRRRENFGRVCPRRPSRRAFPQGNAKSVSPLFVFDLRIRFEFVVHGSRIAGQTADPR